MIQTYQSKKIIKKSIKIVMETVFGSYFVVMMINNWNFLEIKGILTFNFKGKIMIIVFVLKVLR